MSAPVVVGFDGSSAAASAVRHGAREAAQRGTELRIVHAFGWLTLLPPVYTTYDEYQQGPRAAMLDLLTRTANGVREQWPDLPVSPRLLDGSPGGVLVDASRDAQLVVVGHRGIGGFAGLLAGSTAMQLASHAASPVTVVRGPAQPDDAVIVLGMDGSSQALAAADVAFESAQRQRVELVVVYHQRMPSDAGPDAGAAVPQTVTAQVQLLAERYSDVKYRIEAAQGSSAALALIDAAAEFSAGMVVVGSRGQGGFRGLIMGSTSRALVEHATVPVTVVPAAAEPTGGR